MNYEMTDDRRKLLTEFLGEPWYYHRKDFYGLSQNRTFTTPQDSHDVFKKLVDGGKWDDFLDFSNDKWLIDFIEKKTNSSQLAWLFYSPERFNFLVSEWLKEEK